MRKGGIRGIVGFWALIVGLIICLVAGIVSPQNTAITIVLIVLGVIIGFLNITSKETMLFLLATIALVVVGNAFAVVTVLDIGKTLGGILAYITTLVAPAATIAAIKALWAVGRPGD
jgi:hypothetical protein